MKVKVTSKINHHSLWVKLQYGKDWAKWTSSMRGDQISGNGYDEKMIRKLMDFMDDCYLAERDGGGTMGELLERIKIRAMDFNPNKKMMESFAKVDPSTTNDEEASYVKAWSDRKVLRVKHGITDKHLGTKIPTPKGIATLIGMMKGARKNHYIVKLPNGMFSGVDYTEVLANA